MENANTVAGREKPLRATARLVSRSHTIVEERESPGIF